MIQVHDFEDAIRAAKTLYDEKCDECITLQAEKDGLEQQIRFLERLMALRSMNNE